MVHWPNFRRIVPKPSVTVGLDEMPLDVKVSSTRPWGMTEPTREEPDADDEPSCVTVFPQK